MKNRHIRYTFDRKSFFGKAAIFCLILSMVLRGIGGLLNRTIFEDWFTIVEFGLPILCALLYLLSLLIFGRKWFKVTVFPFVLGVMACVVRLFSFDNLMQQEMSVERILVSVFFYLVVTALYSAIAFGGLRSRILLFLLFLVPLGYHAVFEIYPTVLSGFGLNLSLILMELSVLAVIFAMIFVSLALSSKPRVSPVDPESGKNVVPPLPGDRLDEKPPVVTTEAPAEKPLNLPRRNRSPSLKSRNPLSKSRSRQPKSRNLPLPLTRAHRFLPGLLLRRRKILTMIPLPPLPGLLN